jgi:hypothetical protein
MAERFRSNVQRNAQILAEELRQASSLALALCLDVFSDAGRLRNDDAIGLKAVDIWKRIASRISFSTAATVPPVATQPGRSGT